jgi:hypothetical protein
MKSPDQLTSFIGSAGFFAAAGALAAPLAGLAGALL